MFSNEITENIKSTVFKTSVGEAQRFYSWHKVFHNTWCLFDLFKGFIHSFHFTGLNQDTVSSDASLYHTLDTLPFHASLEAGASSITVVHMCSSRIWCRLVPQHSAESSSSSCRGMHGFWEQAVFCGFDSSPVIELVQSVIIYSIGCKIKCLNESLISCTSLSTMPIGPGSFLTLAARRLVFGQKDHSGSSFFWHSPFFTF